MIKLVRVNKHYISKDKTYHALQDIDLHIREGEIFGLLGESGAGKSTLLRVINLLERPCGGDVIVDGTLVTDLSNRQLRLLRSRVGFVFQQFNLLNYKTVHQNIAFPLHIAGQSKVKIQHRVRALLDQVGLSDKADAYPHQLSGGQKQRVGIARALANDPKILLCDEPTSALDHKTTQDLLALLQSIQSETNVTVVIITHEIEVVRAICHRAAVIDAGKIAAAGQADTILSAYCPRSSNHSLIPGVRYQTGGAS